MRTNQYVRTINVGSRYLIQFATGGWQFWDRCLRYRKVFSGLSGTWLLLGVKNCGLWCVVRTTKEKAECTECQSVFICVLCSVLSQGECSSSDRDCENADWGSEFLSLRAPFWSLIPLHSRNYGFLSLMMNPLHQRLNGSVGLSGKGNWVILQGKREARFKMRKR